MSSNNVCNWWQRNMWERGKIQKVYKAKDGKVGVVEEKEKKENSGTIASCQNL